MTRRSLVLMAALALVAPARSEAHEPTPEEKKQAEKRRAEAEKKAAEDAKQTIDVTIE